MSQRTEETQSPQQLGGINEMRYPRFPLGIGGIFYAFDLLFLEDLLLNQGCQWQREGNLGVAVLPGAVLH